jgi:hypothetical protein
VSQPSPNSLFRAALGCAPCPSRPTSMGYGSTQRQGASWASHLKWSEAYVDVALMEAVDRFYGVAT